MIKKKYMAVLILALIFSLPQFLQSQSNYEYIHSPKTDIYFGYVTYTEVEHDGKDPVVIREGEEAPQVAELNFPLLPGDTIRTTGSRRCEIQLDTGTIIRLDLNTELAIETIMAKSLSSRRNVTNFLLNRGEIYIMYKRYSYPEIFQVITPNASVKLNHRTVASIAVREDGGTDAQINFGKAFVLYGPDEDNLMEEVLKRKMSLTISHDHKALQGEYKEDVDFELWNESVNKDFEELHQGMSVIPKPIMRYPKAVVYFAQKYSNIYGEWVWDDLYGYVWRPSYNDYYPWGSWQPYYYGQWSEANGQLFWVPMESWGWVPYHLGLWTWNKKRGWIWIPGSAFAPAWVSWSFFGDYCSWRPWSFSDWYFYRFYNGYLGYYMFEPYYMRDPEWKYFLRQCREEYGIDNVRMCIRQLRKTASSPYALPKEFEGTLKRVFSALEKGDERILASIRTNIEQTVIVRNGDLNAAGIHERAIPLQEVPVELKKKPLSTETLKNPLSEAARIYRKDENSSPSEKTVSNDPAGQKNTGGGLDAITVISIARTEKDAKSEKNRKQGSELRGGRTRNAVVVPSSVSLDRAPQQRPQKLKQTIAHIRDWNPDAGVARRAGVSLKYSSLTNEIKCPELDLSSRMISRSRNMTTMTEFSSSSRRGGYDSGGRISSSSRSVSSSSSQAVSSNRSASSNRASSSSSKNKKESSKTEESSHGKTIKK